MIKQLLNKYKKHLQILGVSFVAIVYLYINSLSRTSQTNPSTILVTPPITPSTSPTLNSQTSPASDSYDYNQAFDKLISDYPWYPSLPLETSNYRVIFDFEKNQFRIRIFNSNVSAAEKQDILSQALKQMESIGVDNTKFKYYILLGN